MARMLGSAQPAMSHPCWITLSLTLRREGTNPACSTAPPHCSLTLSTPAGNGPVVQRRLGRGCVCRERCMLPMTIYETKYEDTSSDRVLKVGRWCHWLIDVVYHLCWMICLVLCGLLRLKSSWVFDKLMRNESIMLFGLQKKSHLELLRSFPTWDLAPPRLRELLQPGFRISTASLISEMGMPWSRD